MHKLLILIFGLVIASCSQVTPPEACLPLPSKEQLAWHQMEMNAFVHFTTNTFTDKEWGYGDESPAVFNPDTVNTDQWVSVLKETGFKGVILTCKHHDGFCLWPSEYTDHTIAKSPYLNGNGNIVKQLRESCTAQDMKFGVYLSPWDRNRSDYGQPSYIEYYRNQLKELFNAYGPVFEMWFDGANGGDGYYGGAKEERRIDKQKYYDWPTTLDLVREIQDDVIFFSDAGPGVRWCGNESGFVNETCWSTITPDTLYAGKGGIEHLLSTGSEDGTAWLPAEVDVSIRPGWFYHASEDSLVKTADELFDIYLTSVGRGALLLLNIPPDRRGVFHENDVASLKAFKAKLDETFSNNYAKDATILASNVRGGSSDYCATNLIDSNRDTYWCTDDNVIGSTIEVALKHETQLNYLVLQEYIELGQRIKKFSVEVYQNGNWKSIANATTVGYKRILPLNGVKADKLRVVIEDAKACPVISTLGIY
ncbi:alpha-L-fucosidase [Plebeiibacterium sediminum]|uniref:alpha-L-fucosidase n=1 Tax=Plebeiibacterium sediminum TaxID=2992112 RepID=A0AAE3SG79_9BACT|nr:alpha-L-fucosidase [Plebeiobacterium sediminum]MCW3788220.1 alpha-L-fucosidase [Plebeiobacterium sediminum]